MNYVKIGNEYRNKKEYEGMKKYYLKSIQENDTFGMCNLGLHYNCIEKNTRFMMKYYLMAINQNNTLAMYLLGIFYYMENNYKNALKFFEMGCLLNDDKCLLSLIVYYFNIEKNYEKVFEYIEKVDENNILIIQIMINYYKNINFNHDNIIKYCDKLLLCENKLDKTIKNYIDLYQDYEMENGYIQKIDETSSLILYDIGYFFYQKKEFDYMIKYLEQSYLLNNIDAAILLGDYYCDKDYQKMKMYYLKAIEKGDSKIAIIRLYNNMLLNYLS
jgi:TPR repeat protein